MPTIEPARRHYLRDDEPRERDQGPARDRIGRSDLEGEQPRDGRSRPDRSDEGGYDTAPDDPREENGHGERRDHGRPLVEERGAGGLGPAHHVPGEVDGVCCPDRRDHLEEQGQADRGIGSSLRDGQGPLGPRDREQVDRDHAADEGERREGDDTPYDGDERQHDLEGHGVHEEHRADPDHQEPEPASAASPTRRRPARRGPREGRALSGPAYGGLERIVRPIRSSG